MSKELFNIFKSEEDFWNIKNDPDNERNAISIIEGSGNVYIGELNFFGSQCAKAGDILIADNESGSKTYTSKKTYKKLKEEGKIGTKYTPIGVCAIPASHTIHGDQGVNKGKARAISLANMSLKTPEKGSLTQGGIVGDNVMYWGDNTKVIGENDPNNNVYTKNPVTGIEFTTMDWGRMPGNEIHAALQAPPYADPSDEGFTSYFQNKYNSNESNRFIPSPYGNNMKKYYSGWVGNFRGKEINDKIISNVTADWSGETIENSYAAGHCPSVCSCKRYHTIGTKAGDWYLPTNGELGVMYSRLADINDSIDLIGPSYAITIGGNKEYGKIGQTNWASYGYWLWSCLETDSGYAKGFGCNYGYMYSWYGKSLLGSSDSRVRSFLVI